MIIKQHQLSDFSEDERNNIVVCSGCFDLMHIGHIIMFEDLKKVASTLIVSVASDSWVSKLKGKNRPIISQEERLAMLDAVRYVDFVFLQEPGNISHILKKYNVGEREKHVWENCIYPMSLLKPKFYAISSEFLITPEIELYCNDENIHIIEVPYFEHQSTSRIISKILTESQHN